MVDIKNNSELKADLESFLSNYVYSLAEEIESGQVSIDSVEDGMDKIGEYIDEGIKKEEPTNHNMGDILAYYCEEDMSDEEFDKFLNKYIDEMCDVLDDIYGENYAKYERMIGNAFDEHKENVSDDGIASEYSHDRYNELNRD